MGVGDWGHCGGGGTTWAAEEPTFTQGSCSDTLHRRQWLLPGTRWRHQSCTQDHGTGLHAGAVARFRPSQPSHSSPPSPPLPCFVLQRSHPGLPQPGLCCSRPCSPPAQGQLPARGCTPRVTPQHDPLKRHTPPPKPPEPGRDPDQSILLPPARPCSQHNHSHQPRDTSSPTRQVFIQS